MYLQKQMRKIAKFCKRKTTTKMCQKINIDLILFRKNIGLLNYFWLLCAARNYFRYFFRSFFPFAKYTICLTDWLFDLWYFCTTCFVPASVLKS